MCNVSDNTTPMRPVRIEDDLWAEFGRLAGARNRSQVLREFVRWYVRERGAQMPTRPESAGFEPPARSAEMTELFRRARNNLAHGSPGGMAVSSDEAEGLLPRELQLLFLVADGVPDAEIAAGFKIAPVTARLYVKQLAAKIRRVGQAKIFVPKGPEEILAAKTQFLDDAAGPPES